MSVNIYETLFLVNPNQASANWDAVKQQANGIIEKHGGEILITYLWGETKLAYMIEKFRKGTYLLTYFRADSQKIKDMEHDFRLADSIIRNMTLKLHPKIAEQKLKAYRESQTGDDATAQESKDEKTESKKTESLEEVATS